MPGCENCSDLEYPRGISRRSAAAYRKVYVSAEDLFASAVQGCSSCLLIQEAVLKFVPNLEPSETILITICLQEYAYDKDEDLVWYTHSPLPFITVTDQLKSKSMAHIDLIREEDSSLKTWRSIPIARRTCGDTSSTAALERSKSWLNSCREKHRGCGSRDQNTAPLLPSRVVDVGESASGSARLHISAAEERAPYLCLSHCWGKVQIVRSLQSNIEDFVQEISWHALSKTFQDAVQVTRSLGFRYIWIDSLCIIQDSVDDWRRESAKMAQYYGSAELTIAATKSSDGNGGLFSLSKEHLLSSGFGSAGPSVYARGHVRHFGYPAKAWKSFPQLKTEDPLVAFPLLTRGWVYQERLLSPRMLHFGPDELIWECREYRDCECMPWPPNHRNSWWSTDIASMDMPKVALNRRKLGSDSFTLESVWRYMVERFTQLDLTFGTDKLPALQGCATVQEDSLRAEEASRTDAPAHDSRTRYLAGIWGNSIPDDLLWHCDKLKPRPKDWRAPSFSWASVDSAIVYPSRLSGLIAQPRIPSAMDCRTWRPSGPFAHRLISDARQPLHLSGVLVQGTLRYSASSLLPEEELDPEVLSNGRTAAGDPHSISAGEVDFVFCADYALSVAGTTHVPSGATIHALRVAQSLEIDGVTNTDGIDFSLVLRCVDEAEQLYERIGLLDIITKSILDLAEVHLFAGQTARSKVTII